MTREEQYKADMLIEAGVAKFLDSNFYGKFKVDTHRYHDTEHQFAGIDTTIKNVKFDEKIKVRGCLNQVYGYLGFEVSMLNKGNHVQDGWFCQSLSTDYYTIIGVYSYGNDENAISATSAISACDVLWVKKSEVVGLVEKEMTIDELKSDAKELRENNPYAKYKKRKTYSHRKFWLTYSPKKDEKPVNLVIPRETLEKLPGSKHFVVYRGQIERR